MPGAVGGWLLLLEQFGTWPLDEVLAYAIGYAEHGYPVVAGITATIEAVEPLLRGWPGSAELYLPAPRPGSIFRNPQLAATWRRLLDESGGTVEGRAPRLLRGLRRRRDRPLRRASEDGFLDGGDLAAWRATLEPPATVDYRGLTVCKTAAWGQGPAGLQQLRLLEGFDVAGARRGGARARHAPRRPSSRSPTAMRTTATRTCRSSALLSREYADERRRADRRGGERRAAPGPRPAAAARSLATSLLLGGGPTRPTRPAATRSTWTWPTGSAT